MWVGAQGAYFCISRSCVMETVAHNVHRSAALRHTPDGGEIFTDIFFFPLLSSSLITRNVLKTQNHLCPACSAPPLADRGCPNGHAAISHRGVFCGLVWRKFGDVCSWKTESVCLLMYVCTRAWPRAPDSGDVDGGWAVTHPVYPF